MDQCLILRGRHLGVSQVFPHVADSLSVEDIAVVRAMQSTFDSVQAHSQPRA